MCRPPPAAATPLHRGCEPRYREADADGSGTLDAEEVSVLVHSLHLVGDGDALRMGVAKLCGKTAVYAVTTVAPPHQPNDNVIAHDLVSRQPSSMKLVFRILTVSLL